MRIFDICVYVYRDICKCIYIYTRVYCVGVLCEVCGCGGGWGDRFLVYVLGRGDFFL